MARRPNKNRSISTGCQLDFFPSSPSVPDFSLDPNFWDRFFIRRARARASVAVLVTPPLCAMGGSPASEQDVF